METLSRSRKERERLRIMEGVKCKELTLAQASERLGVCDRQAKRIWRRCREGGDAGLVHRRRASWVLRVMGDDATHRVGGQFFEAETTHASDDVFEGWVQRRGLPDRW